MRVTFTKMQGAGNDFVVLDATRAPLALDAAQLRRLGDRRFGVGADQILVVEPAPRDDVDFGYRIFNGATGAEVEQCGNGARCFVRYVHERGLTAARRVRVATMNATLTLERTDDGGVRVDMGAPRFALAEVPFDAAGLTASTVGAMPFWPLDGVDFGAAATPGVGVLSMGNPHAVLRVGRVDDAPVATLGPGIEAHPRFPRRVNVGFVEVLARDRVALRVWERDAGETLACGTGACAAVVTGIRAGWLDRDGVAVRTRGGMLRVAWPHDDASVTMTGPAETVFEGSIDL